MIISKTPLRMSFVGGGSDLPAFYREHGGAVLSTAIDKYVYITVNQRFDDSFRISYSRTEEVPSIDEVQHPLARECLRLAGCPDGVEVTSIADIPARGTGLGSSSSFVVGLLHALHGPEVCGVLEASFQVGDDFLADWVGVARQQEESSGVGGCVLWRHR